MLAGPKPLGSARVPAGGRRASRRKTLFGETPNTTRGDAYAPQTYPENVASQCAFRKRFGRDALSEILQRRFAPKTPVDLRSASRDSIHTSERQSQHQTR